MSGRRAGFLLLGLVIALSYPNPATQVQTDPGAQWLSWSTSEKNAYVAGFIDGYRTGTTEICKAADQFLKAGSISSGGGQPETNSSASAACFASGGDYSKQYSGKAGVDFSVYANMITEFYTKHPDYRAISFRKLLLSLRDGASNSEDQLYQKALHGDLR
jgi:hypothetical protein